MPVMKIGGGVNLLAPSLTISLPAGSSWTLPAGQGVIGGYGAVFTPTQGSNNTLSGQYVVQLGPYSTVQVYDAGLAYWRNPNVQPGQEYFVTSDGTNFRISNSTGCTIGALVTTAGSGNTNGWYGYNNQRTAVYIQNGITTTGTYSSYGASTTGGALWNVIVGGMVNSTISFSGTVYNGNYGVNYAFGATTNGVTASAGSNYQVAPLIVFSPPPNQGAQPYVLPQAVCTISGGAIASVTMTQQGAGLLGLPGITVVPQQGDTTGGGAVLGWIAANNAQVNSGGISLMYPSFYGSAQTSVPSFTFTGFSGSPAATAIMNFTITGVGGSGGTTYGTTPGGIVFGGIVAGTAANNSPGNPLYDKGLSLPVYPPINVTTATGVPSLAGPFSGVNFQAVPLYCAIPNSTAVGSANTNTFTVGGTNDVCVLISI